MQNSHTGDVALVVDAGTDAGYELARELLGAGYRVAVTSRHATELARVVHGYSSSRVLAMAADIGDPAQFQRLIRRIQDRFGRVDLILRAGDSSKTEHPLGIAS
jgi:NADP-dependent 3-hydroxy acid dehydrogenase YdfG